MRRSAGQHGVVERTCSVTSTESAAAGSPCSDSIAATTSGRSRLAQVARREVDRDAEVGAVARMRGGGDARFAQHPAVDRDDRAALLRDRDERRRRDHAARAVVPAHERLAADDPAVTRGRPSAGTRARARRAITAWRRVVFEREPVARGRLASTRSYSAQPVAAEPLRAVHRGVGVRDERLGVAPVLGEDRCADADADEQFAAPHGHRRAIARTKRCATLLDVALVHDRAAAG